ncbi:MAG: hypothetical protein FD157_1405 [Rhodocyclaceae bacterium]|nr:MAG: hypothetical protein FD157_1405 [Rhodocyclaceae bacterium]TND05628.1 MAG: hypothetical protein FD118_326 [Rhodocyclaceae bacterium]
MAGFVSKTAVAYLLWLALAGPALADVRELLAEVLVAHGGGAAPAAIHERGVIESLRRGNGVVERWWQAPDRFRIEIGYPGEAESRLLRGNEAWQQGQPATAAFHGSLLLQAARMALPWRLQENARRVIDLGTGKSSDGKPVRVLEWPVQNGIKLIVEIDAESRLILRSRGILTINNASMEFATGYEDYRIVAGRRVAMIERHFAMGEYTGTTTLDSVEFPAVLPAPTFAPPAGAGGLRVKDSSTPRDKPVLTQAARPLSGP